MKYWILLANQIADIFRVNDNNILFSKQYDRKSASNKNPSKRTEGENYYSIYQYICWWLSNI